MAASARLSHSLPEVFAKFEPYKGEVSGRYHVDFLGARTRGDFVAGLPMVQNRSIMVDEEYFEWIDLLESVVAARGSYTMLDLGAGFGRWSVRAAFALKQYNSLPHQLIAVEAEPVVFKWMERHFEDNHIDPSHLRLIHGAISNTPGDVLFYIGGPRGGPWDKNPDDWYGQSLAKDYDVQGEYEQDGEYHGFPVRLHKSGWRSIAVPGVPLASLLNDLALVDLIDMDIEGQELPSVLSTIEELDTKVKRLHIGTHGKDIEEQLRQILATHGWQCLFDYSLFSKAETPWGPVDFENGVQSWVNPRLM